MYEYIEESQTKAMDNWKDTNDLYDIEEIAEDFLPSLSVPITLMRSLTNEQIHEQSNSNNDNIIQGRPSSVESNNTVSEAIPALES